MGRDREAVKLVQITTVPLSLGFIRGQAGYLRERGVGMAVVSSPGELLDRFAESEHVPVYPVEMTRRITPVQDARSVHGVFRVLRRLEPGIVHANTPKAGLIGMMAAVLARAPIRIYHIHGLPFMTATGRKRWLLRRTESVACSLAHQVFCVSHSIRDVAIQEAVCPPEKIKVLCGGSANGIDAQGCFSPGLVGDEVRHRIRSEYGIPLDAVVVGYVGRIVRDKGMRELVDAWKRLSARFPDHHLLLVGPFEPQDPVPPEVEQYLRTSPRIHLAGHVHEVAPLYAAMDLLVLPTYREGLPTAPLEAASMGLPVVATRVPGCTDAVQDGTTGTLVPPRDSAMLADALQRYMTEPALRRRHGAAGRERVLRDFGQENIWQALLGEYQRLLSERRVLDPSILGTLHTGSRIGDRATERTPSGDNGSMRRCSEPPAEPVGGRP